MAASDITLTYCSKSSRIDVLWHFKQAEPRSQQNKHAGRCKAVASRFVQRSETKLQLLF